MLRVCGSKFLTYHMTIKSVAAWTAVLIVSLSTMVSAEIFERADSTALMLGTYPTGAVSRAMGGGMATAWGSPNGGFWNPAQVANGSSFGGSYDFERPLPGVIGDWERRMVAVTGSFGDFTLRLLDDEWTMGEPFIVRTAYQPEGTGETWELRNELTVASLSWGGLQWDHAGSTSWLSLGSGIRRTKFEIGSSVGTAIDLDLGLVLSNRLHSTGEFGLRKWNVGISRTNVFEEPLVFDTTKLNVPGAWRIGASLEWVLSQGPTEVPELLLTSTADWQSWHLHDEWTLDDRMSFGIEALVMNSFAMRYGHGNQQHNAQYKNSSFGFGVRFAFNNERLQVYADMSSMEKKESLDAYSKNLLDDEALKTYSLRIELRP